MGEDQPSSIEAVPSIHGSASILIGRDVRLLERLKRIQKQGSQAWMDGRKMEDPHRGCARYKTNGWNMHRNNATVRLVRGLDGERKWTDPCPLQTRHGTDGWKNRHRLTCMTDRKQHRRAVGEWQSHLPCDAGWTRRTKSYSVARAHKGKNAEFPETSALLYGRRSKRHRNDSRFIQTISIHLHIFVQVPAWCRSTHFRVGVVG